MLTAWPGPLHWPVSPIDSVNASGMKVSSTTMSLEPVPRRPTTFQTSTIWYFSRGTMKVRKSTTWPSSLKTRPPSSTQLQWSQPDEKLHLPDSLKPPSASTALPVGAYDELSRTFWSSPHTACWASSSNSATCHGWTPDHAGHPAGRTVARRRCRAPRCRSRPGRPRSPPYRFGCSSRKKPVSSSSLIEASGTTRNRSPSSERSRNVGSRSRTPSRTDWTSADRFMGQY